MALYGTLNQSFFDCPWSGVHFASGLLIGLALAIVIRKHDQRLFIVGVSLLVLWELVEITLHYLDVHAHEFIAPLKASVAGFAFAPETITNVVGDLVIGSIGLFVGRFIVRTTRPRG